MRRIDFKNGERAYVYGEKEDVLANDPKGTQEALNWLKQLTGPPLKFLMDTYSKLLKRDVECVWIAMDKEGNLLSITVSLEDSVAPTIKVLEATLERMRAVEKKEQN